MALSDFRTLVGRLLRAPADQVTPEDVDRVLGAAVLRYSLDAPRTLVRDVTWATDGCFGPPPAEMSAASRLLQAEYPVGDVPPTLLELGLAVEPPGTLQLVSTASLAAGAVVRVEFTAAHVLDAGEDTVPPEHRDAVGAFAAHLLCRELATLFSGERDSSIAADGSDTDSRARNFAARAREYRGAYYAALGMADPQGGDGGARAAPTPEGAGAVAAWPGRARPWFRTTGG